MTLLSWNVLKKILKMRNDAKEELIRWNRLYGTSIDSDITNMWESATAFSRFSDNLLELSGLASVIAGIAK